MDNHLSDAQLATDATTDYGKRKVDLALGFARINDASRIDDEHPKNSRIDFTIYPGSPILPSIDENGDISERLVKKPVPTPNRLCELLTVGCKPFEKWS